MKYRPSRLSKNNKGVTLVEVIAVIAVMSVVMAAVTGFMITGARMSAQVSGGAAASMQEQTAAEYIDRWILEVSMGDLGVIDPIKDDNEVETGYYKTLLIQGRYLTVQDGKVTFNDKVELCDGSISFILNEENNTVTYILNDVRHVVHLRIASGASD